MELQKQLQQLRNLSYRHAQKHPDDIPNFYDREIEALFAIARAKGVKLDEEGYFDMDQKSIAVAKKKSHG
jgi:hypothetical protein